MVLPEELGITHNPKNRRIILSLSRKFLAALGLEADKIDQIIEAHTDSLEGIKAERDKYKELVDKGNDDAEAKAKEIADAQKELDELKKQVEADAKEREGKDYDKLKKEFDDYKAEQEAKATNAAKESALKELLTDMKMSDKGSKQVLKWMGVTKVELDENGKIKDASNLRKAIKEDWGDYIQSEGEKGADTSNPPENNGGKKYSTKEEIMNIKDRNERQQAISENHELFGY